MNTARDNFFKDCPAVMDYSSFTDYRTAHRREQYIRTINGITNDYDYKNLLQSNASKIMKGEADFFKSNYSCAVNPCIHNSPTSPTPGDFNIEMQRYNRVRVTGDASSAKCAPEQDYKTSY